MIQFIELVPELVKNEQYEAELKDWIAQGSIGFPPTETEVRHHNNPIGHYPWVQVECNEIVCVHGVNYMVQCVGPKEFATEGFFNQNVYIQKLP